MNYGGAGCFHRDFSQNQTGRIIRSLYKVQLPVSVRVPKDQFSHGKVSDHLCLIKQRTPPGIHSPTLSPGLTCGVPLLDSFSSPHPRTPSLVPFIHWASNVENLLLFMSSSQTEISWHWLWLTFSDSTLYLFSHPTLTFALPSACMVPPFLTNLPPRYGFWTYQSSPISLPALLISDKCW